MKQQENKKRSIVIFYYAGPHDDDADTMECAQGIEESFQRLGLNVKKVKVTKHNWREAVETPGDVFFNFVEDDTWNLYQKVGRRLATLRRPQVGHDLKSFRYAISKRVVKQKMKSWNIRTPRFQIFPKKQPNYHHTLNYPIIIKPSKQHAGIGISQRSVVTSDKELIKRIRAVRKTYPGEIIAEEYIPGREIHVTVFGNDQQLTVLPYCEVSFAGKFKKKWAVYTYRAKWDKESWEYWDARVHAPAKLSRKIQTKIEKIVLKAYKKFDCKDIARFDIRLNKKNNPYIVDINLNPSLNYYDKEDATLASVYAYNWTYDEFMQKLAATTFQRTFGKEEKF